MSSSKATERVGGDTPAVLDVGYSPAEAKRLFYNIARNRWKPVERLLKDRPGLIHAKSQHYFPLQAAALHGRDGSCVDLLLKAGADPNAVASLRHPHRLHTPLRLALLHCPWKVGALLDAGAKVHGTPVLELGQGAVANYTESELQQAVQFAPKVVPRLLQEGVLTVKQAPLRGVPALSMALREAFPMGRKRQWSQFEEMLGAVECLVEAQGIDTTASSLGRDTPDAHVLWAIRWLPGLAEREALSARVEALLEGLPMPTGRAGCNTFLHRLALISKPSVSGAITAPLESWELERYQQELVARFGQAQLSSLLEEKKWKGGNEAEALPAFPLGVLLPAVEAWEKLGLKH